MNEKTNGDLEKLTHKECQVIKEKKPKAYKIIFQSKNSYRSAASFNPYYCKCRFAKTTKRNKF
jgi:hypothetical protein